MSKCTRPGIHTCALVPRVADPPSRTCLLPGGLNSGWCWSCAKAQLMAEWSQSWHSVQKVPSTTRCTLGQYCSGLQGRMYHIPSQGAACCQNNRSYSNQPDPPCLRDSLMMGIAYANLSRVTWSVVPTARKDKKQHIYDERVLTSRTLGLTETWSTLAPMEALMSSRWPLTATLSSSSSRISI